MFAWYDDEKIMLFLKADIFVSMLQKNPHYYKNKKGAKKGHQELFYFTFCWHKLA